MEKEKKESIDKVKQEIAEAKIEKAPIVERMYQVLSIRLGTLHLMDEAGNGINIPLPTKYKNVQKGDIIYF